MTSKLSIPGTENPVVEFGYIANCPLDSVCKISEHPNWFPIPKNNSDEPIPNLNSKIIQKTIIKETSIDLIKKKVDPLDFILFSDSHEINATLDLANKTQTIVDKNLSQEPQIVISEPQLPEMNIVPLKVDTVPDPIVTNQESTASSESKKKKINQENQTKKTQTVVDKKLPKPTGEKNRETQKTTVAVAKEIIPAGNEEIIIEEPSKKQSKPKHPPQKETYQELLEKLSTNPQYFLKIEENQWDKKQYKAFAKTALVLAILGKKIKDSKIIDEIKERAKKVLPQDPSILKNDEEFGLCEEKPDLKSILQNNHQFFLGFYDKYLDLSYDQILTMLELLQTDFTQSDNLHNAAIFSLAALASIPAIARKIAKGDFGEEATVCLFFCMAYHRSDIDIFKAGSKRFAPLMLLASDSIKKAPGLSDCWLKAGIAINYDHTLVFEDHRFPKGYRQEILKSDQLILEGIHNNPSIVLHAKNVSPHLLKNALARLLLNKDVEELFGKYKEQLLALAKKHLPTVDSEIKNQEGLDQILLLKPKVREAFNLGGSIEVIQAWKDINVNCSFTQFIDALNALKLLLEKPISYGKNLLKNYSFFSLVDVQEAMEYVLNYVMTNETDSTTQQTIVQLYPRNRRFVEIALATDQYKRALYFADDSIRYDPKLKNELVRMVTTMLTVKGIKALESYNFPKQVLYDVEIVSELMKINPEILKHASKSVKKKLKYEQTIVEKSSDSIVESTKQQPENNPFYEELLEKISSDPSELLNLKESDWDKTQLKMFAKTALVTLKLEEQKKNKILAKEAIEKKAEKLLPKEPSKVKSYDEFHKTFNAAKYSELFKISHEEMVAFYNKNLDLSYHQILTLLTFLTEPLGSSEQKHFAALALLPIKKIALKIAREEFGTERSKITPNCMIYHHSNLEIMQRGSQLCSSFLLLATDTIKNVKELKPYWLEAGIDINFKDHTFIFEDSRFPKEYIEELLNSEEAILNGIHISSPSIILQAGQEVRESEMYSTLVKNALYRLMSEKDEQGNLRFVDHKEALINLAKKVLPTKPTEISNQKGWDEYLEKNPQILKAVREGGNFDIDLASGDFFDLSYEQFMRSLISLNIYLYQGKPKELLFKEYFFTSLIDIREAMLNLLQHSKMCESISKQFIIQFHSDDSEMVSRALIDEPNGWSLYFADDCIRYDEDNKKALAKLTASLIRKNGEKVIDEDPRFPKKALDDVEVLEEMMKIDYSYINYASSAAKKHPKYADLLYLKIEKLVSELSIEAKHDKKK